MPRLARRLAPAVCLAVAGLVAAQPQNTPPAPSAAVFDLRHENVLGTSFQLLVGAGDEAAAHAIGDAALAEIERLALILSSHDEHSELRAHLAGHGPARAAPELIEVLQACARWHAASQGAFQPGVEVATRRWSKAEADNVLPSAEELAAIAAELRQLPWQIDADAGSVRFAAAVCLDALAKGYIVDRALRAAGAAKDSTPILLAIGGDMAIAAGAPRTIAITDPRAPADNAEPLCQLALAGCAVASSGGYHRGFRVAGHDYAHIIDPRTARPAEGILGASVVAPDCATADALATILNVVPPQDGLRLVASVRDAACIIVDRTGCVHRSGNWSKLEVKAAEASAPTAAGSAAPMQLHVEFEINQPGSGGGRPGRGRGGSKRPYVAVWIENAEGKPVRTLCLWFENGRWLPDLQRWYRQYRGQRDLIDAVSQATRKAGKYELVWDGKGDDGKPVGPGEFTVLIEAAREHGTYQLMRQPVQIGAQPFTHTLAGNIEIKAATVRLLAKKPQ